MAFKSFSQYQADKNGDFFTLPNDGDFADVIFLYRNIDDVLVADVHYINTTNYKGYVHCCGEGCPACKHGPKGIRMDTKLFIPLYNIQKDKIEFWDRSTFFEQTLQKYVFGPFPTPWEAVFRIVRRGEARSRDTTYEITPVGRNSSLSYDAILSKFNTTFPAGYSIICKEMSSAELSSALNSSVTASDLQDYGYTPIPRGEFVSNEITVPTPEYSAPPEVAPPAMVDYNMDYVSSDNPSDDVAPSVPFDEPTVDSSVPVDQSTDDSSDSLDDVKF